MHLFVSILLIIFTIITYILTMSGSISVLMFYLKIVFLFFYFNTFDEPIEFTKKIKRLSNKLYCGQRMNY